MTLSFRSKAILGIALIEGVLLSMLIFSVLYFLRDSNEDQFFNHIKVTHNIFAAATQDVLLSNDLAELESVATLLSQNPSVVFVRIVDSRQRVLAEAGPAAALSQPFHATQLLSEAESGIFRSARPIEVSGHLIATEQIGFDVDHLQQTLKKARDWSLAIAALEIFLVALFSLLLGGYLSRQVTRFTQAAQKIGAGVLGIQLPVQGQDEIAEATNIFNAMSVALLEAHSTLEAKVADRTAALAEANRKLQHLLGERSMLLESQSVGLITLQERTVTWCNSTFLHMLGHSSMEEVVGKTTRQFYAHEADFVAVGQAYREQGDLAELKRDFEFIRRDGHSFWVNLSGTRLPAPGQSLWVIVDVTERVHSQIALARSESKFRALFESTSEAILMMDGKTYVDCNSAATKIFGAESKDEICHLMPAKLSPEMQPCGTESWVLSEKWIALAYEKGCVRFDWTYHRLDSQQSFPTEVMLSLVEYDGHKLLLTVVWDISERIALIHKIEQQANFDHLTGMCNRRYFMDLAERELERARRYEKPLAVLGIDIDHFKQINDSHGHKAGDLALKKFADTCQDVVRQTDLVGRLGGEEFAVMLPDTSLDRAREIAERLRKRVEEMTLELPENQAVLRFTISIGLAWLPTGQHAEVDTLLQNADAALYDAKRAGRNRVVVA